MKIIKKDNFDRDTVSDVLIAENVSQFYVPLIVKFLNENLGGYYVVEPDDYKYDDKS